MANITVSENRNYDDTGSVAITGTITSSTSSTTVTGTGTSFTTNILAGAPIYSGTNFIGNVDTVTNNTTLVLTANAAIAVTNDTNGFAYNHLALNNGQTITINGATLTINADVRWNQQGAVFGSTTISSSLGGGFVVDGTQIWEIPFSASTGNVPTQNDIGFNGVTGGTSGATGELTRVWETGNLEPSAAGGAMPATGWIKLRSKTGTFQNGETITLPGGATITASGAGKRSWIHVVGRDGGYTLTIPRLGSAPFTGDWYELGTTTGVAGQTVQFPVLDECPAVQIETSAGSGVYEWWCNAASCWTNNGANTATFVNVTNTNNVIAGATGAIAGGQFNHGNLLRETTTNGVHSLQVNFTGNQFETGNLIYRTLIKKETRRYIHVQAHSGTNRYGALFDFDTGTVISTNSVGSPTGTSNTVTSLSGGWYYISLTLDHTLTNTSTLNVSTANSSTPTYDANGIPTFAGLTTEGFYYAERQVLNPTTAQIATDNRGKFFFSDATTGLLTFADRTGRSVGKLPAANCKIRIPNIILSNANAIDYTRNILFNRYAISTTASGVIDHDKILSNWANNFSTPYSVDISDSVYAPALALTNVGATTNVTNTVVGISNTTAIGFTITNSYNGGTIQDLICVGQKSTVPCSLGVANEFTFNNLISYYFGPRLGRYQRTASANCIANSCNNLTFNNYIGIGGLLSAGSCTNLNVNNSQTADSLNGETIAGSATFTFIVSSCISAIFDGLSIFDNISNVHPESAIFSITGGSGLVCKNIGTIANPFPGGTSVGSEIGRIATLANTINCEFRRIYVSSSRSGLTNPINDTNTSQKIRVYNVWAPGAQPHFSRSIDRLSQGCKWSNSHTVNNAVYGTHWEDAFVSDTDGRIVIACNEPIPVTANQCSGTFGTNAGFTAAGSASLPNLSDTITWTIPYYILGYTSLATFASATFNNPWLVTGTNVKYLEFDYQIDTGAGFSAWKHLFNQSTRSTTSSGVIGTNTVTITLAEYDAMLRKPQIGDYIQTASNRLPHGTTITNVVSNTITTSNNFTSSVTSGEAIFFWKDIATEVISPNTGFKLKVRVKVNTASSTTLLSYLRIPADTNSTDQQIQYPLPVTQYTFTISNIINGSRLLLKRTDTNAVLENLIVSGTSFIYTHTGGNIPIEIILRKASSSPYYQEWKTTALLIPANNTITANQETDQ